MNEIMKTLTEINIKLLKILKKLVPSSCEINYFYIFL